MRFRLAFAFLFLSVNPAWSGTVQRIIGNKALLDVPEMQVQVGTLLYGISSEKKIVAVLRITGVRPGQAVGIILKGDVTPGTLVILAPETPTRNAVSAQSSWTLEQYLAAAGGQLANSPANPNNQVLALPSSFLAYDIRLEYRYVTESTRWLVRPRGLLQYQNINAGQTNEVRQSTSAANVTDANVKIRLSDSWETNVGLEVYQWGPAELFNASNPLFHLNTANRSAYFKEKGQVLARLTFDPGRWNTILIVNPVANNEQPYKANANFYPNGLLKTELRASGGQNYIGLLGGIQPDRRSFVGTYENYSFESGLSVYADARVAFGFSSYHPGPDSLGQVHMIDQQTSDLAQLAVIGIRFESSVDLRLEFFYNSEGYQGEEFQRALSTLQVLSPYTPQNFAGFLKSGLELYGQKYLYFSMRISNLTKKKDMTILTSVLGSLQDNSLLWNLSLEKPLSNSIVMHLEGRQWLGNDNSELTLFQRSLVFAGIKWTL